MLFQVYYRTDSGDRLRIRCSSKSILPRVKHLIELTAYLLIVLAEEREAHPLELSDWAKEYLHELKETVDELELMRENNPTLKLAIRRK
jgi:hypothetical protein